MVGLRATLVCIAATILTVSGCRTESNGTISANSPGPAEAFVAVYANSSYDDSDLHGTIVLIDEDGRTTLRETRGLYGGELGWAKGALHFSDLDSEFSWGPSGKVTERRRKVRDPLQHWAGTVGDEYVAVFNSGLNADGRYAYNVSIWGPAGLATASVHGTLWGVTECDGQLLALVEDDSPTRNVRVLVLEREDASVTTREVGRLSPPDRGSEYSAIGCAESTLTVMAQTRRQVFIGQLSEMDEPWTWRLTDVEIGEYPRKFTQIGNEFVAIDAEDGEVVAVDMDAGSTLEYGSLPDADLYRYSGGARGEFVVVSQSGSDVRVVVFDHPGGQVLLEVDVDGLGDVLSERNEILTGSPGLNPSWMSEARRG